MQSFFQSHSTNGNPRSFRRTSSIAAACPIILNSKLPNGNGYTGNGNVGRLDALEDLPCEKVSREVYIYYLKALGASPVSFAMVLYVLYQVHKVGKILKAGLNLIPSPSPSLKIHLH